MNLNFRKTLVWQVNFTYPWRNYITYSVPFLLFIKLKFLKTESSVMSYILRFLNSEIISILTFLSLLSQKNMSLMTFILLYLGFVGWVLKVHYTDADFKICLYLRLHMKIISWKFHINTPFTFCDMRTWDM